MTKQRFRIEVDENCNVRILDNGADIGQYEVCKILNELYEENKALKKELEYIEEEYYEYTLINGDGGVDYSVDADDLSY